MKRNVAAVLVFLFCDENVYTRKCRMALNRAADWACLEIPENRYFKIYSSGNTICKKKKLTVSKSIFCTSGSHKNRRVSNEQKK